jgi:hypothetical protein
VLDEDTKSHGIHDVANVPIHTVNQDEVEQDIRYITDSLEDGGFNVYNFGGSSESSAFSVVEAAREFKNNHTYIWIQLEDIEGAGEPTVFYGGGDVSVAVEDFPTVPNASTEGAIEAEQELYKVLDDAGIPVEGEHEDRYDQH